MREFNQRGQESKFLTGFPTLLIILVFIGIFIGFSFTLAGGKNIRGMSGIEPEDAGTFLYQPIIADGTETLIIDEVARVAVQGRFSQGLEQGLAELRTRSNTYECILLAFAPENPVSQGLSEETYLLFLGSGEARTGSLALFARYHDAALLRPVSVATSSGTRLYIDQYAGRCLS